MDFLSNLLNNNDFWKTPIYRKPTNSLDEEDFVNCMAYELLTNNKMNILIITNKIINSEIKKKSRINIHKELLIRNQIYSNMIENITALVLNIAKDYYDEYIKEQEVFSIIKPKLDSVNYQDDNQDNNQDDNQYISIDISL